MAPSQIFAQRKAAQSCLLVLSKCVIAILKVCGLIKFGKFGETTETPLTNGEREQR